MIGPFDQRLRLNRFVVLGRVGLDLYAAPPGTRIEEALTYTAALGGSAGNICVALARQGAQVSLLTCTSDDAVGRYCLAELDRYGVDTTHVRTVGGQVRNALAIAETVPSNCQAVLYRNGAADLLLTVADVNLVDFDRVGALIVTGTALSTEPSRAATLAAMAQAKAAGAMTVLDVDWRPAAWASANEAASLCGQMAALADVVIGNDDEFGVLAGGHDKGEALAQSLAQTSARFCVYKRGPDGATTFTRDGPITTPIFAVKALKPLGAGDGFMGGLMAALAQGHSLTEALRRGAATAAMIVAGIGCAPASPRSDTLEVFLARNPSL